MSTQTVTRGLTNGQKLAGGLTVVLKSGKLYYRSSVYAKHLPNGQSTKLVAVSEMTITEAKDWHAERRVEVRGLKGKVTDQTLRFALESRCKFIREEAQREGDNETYAETLERNFRNWVEPFGIADMKLSAFEDSTALNFVRYLKRQPGLAYDTRMTILNSVRTPLKHAREQGWMKRGYDPFRDIDPKEYGVRETKTKRTLDNEEMERLVKVLLSEEFRKATDTDYSNAIIIHSLEGGRSSETLGRRYRDVRKVVGEDGVERYFIEIGSQLAAKPTDERQNVRTKNRKVRFKAMHPMSVAAMKRQRAIEWAKGLGQEDDLFFTMADGDVMDRWNLRRAVARAAKMAGIDNVTPRDLRRSLCTVMEHAGVGDAEASADTGHDPATRRKFYVVARDSDAQKLANTAAVVGSGYGMVEEAL